VVQSQEVEDKEQYHVDVCNRFPALELIDAVVEIIVLGKRLDRT
jgi:hypothetical protein